MEADEKTILCGLSFLCYNPINEYIHLAKEGVCVRNYNLEISYSKKNAELEIYDGVVKVLYENVKDECDMNNVIESFLEDNDYTE